MGTIIVNPYAHAAAAPPEAGPSLWLKADAILGVPDGDTFPSWVRSDASGGNATQSNGGQQPRYLANQQNGLPCVRFEGEKWFDLASGFADFTAGMSFFAVVRMRSDSYYSRILKLSNESGNNIEMIQYENEYFQGWYTYINNAGGGNVNNAGFDYPDLPPLEEFGVISCTYQGGEENASILSYSYLNETLDTTRTLIVPNNVTRTLNRVGYDVGVTQNIDIGEILLYPEYFDNTKMLNKINELKTKWGVS